MNQMFTGSAVSKFCPCINSEAMKIELATRSLGFQKQLAKRITPHWDLANDDGNDGG